jgi:hypothetical protein
MNKNLYAYLAFVGMSLFLLLFIYYAKPPCEAIEQYHYSTINHLFSNMLLLLVIMLLLLLLGVFVFLVLYRRYEFAKKQRFLMLYWGLYPLLLFSPFLIAKFNDFQHHKVQQAICEKSMGNGLEVETEGLSMEEYQYLQKQLSLLPDLPVPADSVNLYYYHDDMLGDYNLSVHIIVESSLLKSIPEIWKIEVDSSKNLSTLRYSKHQI